MNEQIQGNNDYLVELEFNGKPVLMVPFVEEIVRNVILGLAKPMRGYTPGDEIKVIIKEIKKE